MESASQRLTRNTIALYLRMGIATIVSLFTSRIVLKELGVDSYGTYTVVAGIVTFWLFLNSSMAVASSRFLSIVIEKKNHSLIKKTFSSVLLTHLIIALSILILGETFGLWFFHNKLVIQPDILHSATIVYQLSIFTVITGVLQVPFSSLFIAREQMSVFAILEIVNSGIKLLSAILLCVVTSNKLAYYGWFVFAGSCMMLTSYFYLAHRYYKDDITPCKCDRKDVKNIFSFTVWDLFGNGAVSLRMQGTSVIYNWFVGAVANAALGISLQVHGVVTAFANNVATALRPQIIKCYVKQDWTRMEHLVVSGSKIMSGLILIPIVPIMMETPLIMKIWLGDIPEYVVGFTRLTILSVYYWTFSTLLHSVIHATGKVRGYSIISGVIILSEVLLMYVFFKVYVFVYTPQILRIIMLIALGIIMLTFIKRYIPEFNTALIITQVYLRGTVILLISLLIPFILLICMEESVSRFCAVAVISLASTTSAVWFLSFGHKERDIAKMIVMKKFIKKSTRKTD